ncbi:MAG: aldehyde dehydrogenase family protein, partial [Janthinobacterium lividum]
SYLEVTIDHVGDTPMGPRPDLRRMLVALGPVAVFGASNFPLAFSVPGGDTASALAAGCPVVIKAHGSHPATSRLCFEVMAAAAAQAGAPAGTLALVHGLQAGAALVAHPAVRAAGFTGSLGGGKALVEIIEARLDPIPFFGELASLNPLVITPAAAAQRGPQIAAGAVASFTLGAGQFCTKPGLVFVPTGADGDRVLQTMATAVTAVGAQVLLDAGIADSYARGGDELVALPGVEEVAHGGVPREDRGAWATPRLLSTTARELTPAVTEECFGPVAVVVRYEDEADLLLALREVPASLTATVHRGAGEVELPALIVDRLADKAGRFLFDAYPTGVAVSWAQHHGGPWPSTNSQHTSVGTSAIRRFLRPVSYQGAPADLLPAELREGPLDIPRRVDGVLQVPTS